MGPRMYPGAKSASAREVGEDVDVASHAHKGRIATGLSDLQATYLRSDLMIPISSP